MEVTWFNHAHEDRNDLLRFGLMRLHRAGRIQFSERPLAVCASYGFSARVAEHTHRHTSVILLKENGRSVRCLVDSEDSFFWISDLMPEVDVYFCAGYAKTFFEDKSFARPYAWQTDAEVAFYEDRAAHLIDKFGGMFGRVRPFVPIGPNLHRKSQRGGIDQKFRNAQHRLHSAFSDKIPWQTRHADYENRYASLLGLRDKPLLYDIVLSDTLWGWPRHRLALHQRLSALPDKYAVHSRLGWSEPFAGDGSVSADFNKADFPMTRGQIDDYESMLASSRLGVFATGFHYGWRNIMTLALLVGLPVYADRSLLQPWFDLSRFQIWSNTTNTWPDLEAHLCSLSEPEWRKTKRCNQNAYDALMGPEQVATYFVDTAMT